MLVKRRHSIGRFSVNQNATTEEVDHMPPTDEQKKQIIDLLIESYNSEIETVTNYLANSVNLDGVRAKEIKESLAKEIQDELGHAQRLADRIHTLGGVVPGSQSLKWTQKMMQPPAESTDLTAVIRGVIEAESDAIKGYQKIVETTDGIDFVTQDLAIELMGDEQQHKREFEGYLKEYEKGA